MGRGVEVEVGDGSTCTECLGFLTTKATAMQTHNAGKLFVSLTHAAGVFFPFARNKYHSAKCYHHSKVICPLQFEPDVVPVVGFDVFVQTRKPVYTQYTLFALKSTNLKTACSSECPPVLFTQCAPVCCGGYM